MLKNLSNLGKVLNKSELSKVLAGDRIIYGCVDGTTGIAVIDSKDEYVTLCAGHLGLAYSFSAPDNEGINP